MSLNINERRDKLIADIEYYEKRIEELRNNVRKESFVDNEDSSDSDCELQPEDTCPSVPELKIHRSMLETCLHATQELTSLKVLESGVTVLASEPDLQGERPVSEDGIWREVTVECRCDLVPFSITFYTHTPNRKFAQTSFRCLRLTAVKAAHEKELNQSVLVELSKPSDAVEVLRSYALAHRSRRSTLAKLANQFANTLQMEPMPEGGYVLKCADLLEISWTLQNKWSPVAAFHHRLKFDLEYMDESYLRIITQAHKQLSDPSIDTDERTILLAKIISTCLEAQGPTQDLYESMSSDPETAQKMRTRRTTLDQVPEAPEMKKRTDKEIMAPPKTLPKVKAKKVKNNDVVDDIFSNIDNGVGEIVKTSNAITKTNVNKDDANDMVKANNAKVKSNVINKDASETVTTNNAKSKNDDKDARMSKIAEKHDKTADSVPKNANSVAKLKPDGVTKDINKAKINAKTDNVAKTKTVNATKSKNDAGKNKVGNTGKTPNEKTDGKDVETVKNIASNNLKRPSVDAQAVNAKKPKTSVVVAKSKDINDINKNDKVNTIKNHVDKLKEVVNNKQNVKAKLGAANNKIDQTETKTVNEEQAENNKKSQEMKKVVVNRKSNQFKVKDKIVNKETKQDKHIKPLVKERIVSGNGVNLNPHDKNINAKLPLKSQNKATSNLGNKLFAGNINSAKNSGNTEKENSTASKIPQKKVTSIPEFKKKNPLRFSPRTQVSKFKMAANADIVGPIVRQKSFSKPSTNIPRLMTKKLQPKTKT